MELCHLLAILVGVERSTEMVRSVLTILEDGRPISWYEKNLRNKYGGD